MAEDPNSLAAGYSSSNPPSYWPDGSAARTGAFIRQQDDEARASAASPTFARSYTVPGGTSSAGASGDTGLGLIALFFVGFAVWLWYHYANEVVIGAVGAAVSIAVGTADWTRPLGSARKWLAGAILLVTALAIFFAWRDHWFADGALGKFVVRHHKFLLTVAALSIPALYPFSIVKSLIDHPIAYMCIAAVGVGIFIAFHSWFAPASPQRVIAPGTVPAAPVSSARGASTSVEVPPKPADDSPQAAAPDPADTVANSTSQEPDTGSAPAGTATGVPQHTAAEGTDVPF